MFYVIDFISDMVVVYSVVDLIISCVGVGFIFEFCLLQKFVILVLLFNVVEDYQIKNVLVLVNKNVVFYIKDVVVKEVLLDKVVEIVKQLEILKSLSINIVKLVFIDLVNVIVWEVFKLVDKYRKENGC